MSLPPEEALLHDPEEMRWLHFHRPDGILAAHCPAHLPGLLTQVEAHAAGGGWAVGFLAYEAAPAFDDHLQVRPDPAGFPLAWFGLYPPPAIAHPPLPPASRPRTDWTPSIDQAAYLDAVRRIRTHIAAGDTYQVNFTFRLFARLAEGQPWDLFRAMTLDQGAGLAAYLDTGRWVVASASPELFFSRRGDGVTCRPMKGTAPRGPNPAADQRQAEWLFQSAKNRAENVMIVDMVRNDLGRVAETGSVTVPWLYALERYPTLWQMTSTVTARCRRPLGELVAALFPSASITGAPKARTMELIADLETTPRRLYTGAIGFVAPGRRACFNVAIRTLLWDRHRQQAEYGLGGGIVWGSVGIEEYQEARLKSRVLTTGRPDFDLLETLRWTPGEGFWLLDRHLDRLAAAARYFDYPFDRPQVQKCLTAAVAAPPITPQRVRLRLDRAGQATCATAPLPPFDTTPLCLAVAGGPVEPADPFLHHKTTWRPTYDQARAARPDADDVLLWNEQGELTESTVANLVMEQDGGLVTPPLGSGLLPGVLRGWLVEGGWVREGVLTLADLQPNRRVYLINSVRGWRPARLVGPFPRNPGPGPRV